MRVTATATATATTAIEEARSMVHSPVPLTEYEEHRLHEKIARALDHPDASTTFTRDELVTLRRLKRKLAVRKLQRRHNLEPFDLERQFLRVTKRDESKASVSGDGYANIGSEVLQRFQGNTSLHDCSQYCPALVAEPVTRALISPYTGRHLKPYIHRTLDLEPVRLKLHRQMQGAREGRYSIDFCYLQSQHLAAVNRLAATFFWPGIDVSEMLAHPDFSCVVLYRQLVIGFSCLSPNVSHTEAYVTFVLVHPDWRRAGIGKFLIYHLIQSCAGKDIVLHVSVNNPAVMLYQRFGFRVEERLSGFYEKFLPADSNQSRDAFFMRLAR